MQLRFAGTYRFVFLVDTLIGTGQLARSDDFFDHVDDSLEAYASPFQRWSALHLYIEWVLRGFMAEDVARAGSLKYVRAGRCHSEYCTASSAYLIPVELMKIYERELPELASDLEDWVEVGCPGCPNWTDSDQGPDFDSWEEILDGEFDQMLAQVTEEVFYVLFANRAFLYDFNRQFARLIANSGAHDHLAESGLFKSDARGYTKIARRGIPKWAQRAVFFRDRGRCCDCDRDLGVGNTPQNVLQYDHMVPIAQGGLNDVTNLQLLCRDCNNAKRDETAKPNTRYDRWYSADYETQPRSYPTLERAILSLVEERVDRVD